MKFEIKLTIEDARNICTFIRRSIYEQYKRNMEDCYSNKTENENRIANTITAFEDLRNQIIEQMNKGK